MSTEKKIPLVHSVLDGDGREVPDPTPLAPPVNLRRTLTIAEQVREQVRRELWLAENSEAETFEEANDFEVDGEEPGSPYEFDEDAELERLLAAKVARDAELAQGKKPGSAGRPRAKKASPQGDDPASGEASKDADDEED